MSPLRRSLQRALALAGVLALLGVGVLAATMIADAASGGGDGEATSAAEATPAPKATATPSRTPEPTPTPVPLTAAQRAQRSVAAEEVRAQGFEPVRLRDYDPRRTLRVLLGASASGRRAFFFVGDSFVRTDALEPSRRLTLRRRTTTTVTLRYRVAGGGREDVRFRWNGTALEPQTPVPPAALRQG